MHAESGGYERGGGGGHVKPTKPQQALLAARELMQKRETAVCPLSRILTPDDETENDGAGWDAC